MCYSMYPFTMIENTSPFGWGATGGFANGKAIAGANGVGIR